MYGKARGIHCHDWMPVFSVPAAQTPCHTCQSPLNKAKGRIFHTNGGLVRVCIMPSLFLGNHDLCHVCNTFKQRALHKNRNWCESFSPSIQKSPCFFSAKVLGSFDDSYLLLQTLDLIGVGLDKLIHISNENS